MLLKDSEKKLIESRIAEAEKKTAGEIVVSVTPASADYGWIPFAAALCGITAGTLAFALYNHTNWESSFHLLEWQSIGGCIALGLSLLRPVRRAIVPRKLQAAKVHRNAMAAFVSAGVMETEGRTGILIYVSEFEHRVHILADRAIHEKVGAAYWDAQVKDIVTGIRAGKPAEALMKAVDEMGARLAEHFPRKTNDRNELPNKILTE